MCVCDVHVWCDIPTSFHKCSHPFSYKTKRNQIVQVGVGLTFEVLSTPLCNHFRKTLIQWDNFALVDFFYSGCEWQFWRVFPCSICFLEWFMTNFGINALLPSHPASQDLRTTLFGIFVRGFSMEHVGAGGDLYGEGGPLLKRTKTVAACFFSPRVRPWAFGAPAVPPLWQNDPLAKCVSGWLFFCPSPRGGDPKVPGWWGVGFTPPPKFKQPNAWIWVSANLPEGLLKFGGCLIFWGVSLEGQRVAWIWSKLSTKNAFFF